MVRGSSLLRWVKKIVIRCKMGVCESGMTDFKVSENYFVVSVC